MHACIHMDAGGHGPASPPPRPGSQPLLLGTFLTAMPAMPPAGRCGAGTEAPLRTCMHAWHTHGLSRHPCRRSAPAWSPCTPVPTHTCGLLIRTRPLLLHLFDVGSGCARAARACTHPSARRARGSACKAARPVTAAASALYQTHRWHDRPEPGWNTTDPSGHMCTCMHVHRILMCVAVMGKEPHPAPTRTHGARSGIHACMRAPCVPSVGASESACVAAACAVRPPRLQQHRTACDACRANKAVLHC